MPISLPSSPAVGQTSVQNGRTYTWTGYAWEFVAASGSGADSLLRSLFVPPAPTGLTVTPGNGQASLSWTAPTGVIAQAPITDYREQYSTDGGTTWTTFTAAASTATTAAVAGLNNGTAYVFRVAAINAVGTGPYTAASSAVTPTAFTPSSISGLQLWLDASDAGSLFDATTGGSLVAADGAVARWQDKSGNARHATQATSGSRPLRKTSQQNGRDVLLFDGSNDLLRATYNASGSSGVTVFVVCKRFAASTIYAFSNYEYSTGDGRGLLLGGNTSNAATAQGRPDGGADFKSASSGAATTNYVLATARWNGTSLFAYSNGGGESSVSAPSATFQSSDSVVLGAAYASDPSSIQAFYNIGIGEIIAFNSALSNTDRSLVEQYLINKWGIT